MGRPWARVALNERILVNLKSGKAIGGILWKERGGLLVLRDASIYELGSNPVPLDGDTIIERVDIDFAQRLAPASPAG